LHGRFEVAIRNVYEVSAYSNLVKFDILNSEVDIPVLHPKFDEYFIIQLEFDAYVGFFGSCSLAQNLNSVFELIWVTEDHAVLLCQVDGLFNDVGSRTGLDGELDVITVNFFDLRELFVEFGRNSVIAQHNGEEIHAVSHQSRIEEALVDPHLLGMGVLKVGRLSPGLRVASHLSSSVGVASSVSGLLVKQTIKSNSNQLFLWLDDRRVDGG